MDKRDERLRELKEILVRLPESALIQCLVCDHVGKKLWGDEEYECVCLYYAKGISPDDTKALEQIGFVSIGEEQWKPMVQWIREVTKETKEKKHWGESDGWDETVFSYYDGRIWWIRAWHRLCKVGTYDPMGAQHIPVFDLVHHLNLVVGGRASFARESFEIGPVEWDRRRGEIIRYIQANGQWSWVLEWFPGAGTPVP